MTPSSRTSTSHATEKQSCSIRCSITALGVEWLSQHSSVLFCAKLTWACCCWHVHSVRWWLKSLQHRCTIRSLFAVLPLWKCAHIICKWTTHVTVRASGYNGNVVESVFRMEATFQAISQKCVGTTKWKHKCDLHMCQQQDQQKKCTDSVEMNENKFQQCIVKSLKSLKSLKAVALNTNQVYLHLRLEFPESQMT